MNVGQGDILSEHGVETKFLGEFTECATAVEFPRLHSGASHSATGKRDIFNVLESTREFAGEPLSKMTAVSLDRGDTAEFEAGYLAEMVHMRLPDLSDVADRFDGGTRSPPSDRRFQTD